MACDDIKEEFSDLGIEIEDESVLSELSILTARYSIDPTKISCEYFSFNTKHKLGTKPPSLDSLRQFENEKLKTAKRRPLDPIEGVENLPDCEEVGVCGSPARLVSKRGPVTPESHLAKRFVSAVGSPVISISAPSSPSVSQCGPGLKYSERKKKGELVVSHNTAGWEEDSHCPEVDLRTVQSVKEPYKFMFSRMRDTAAVLDDTLCRVRARLVGGHGLDMEDLLELGTTHPVTGVGVGRVQCDSEGRLNSNSGKVHLILYYLLMD